MKTGATLEDAASVGLKKHKIEDPFSIWLVDDDACWCEHMTWFLNLQTNVKCSRCFNSPIPMLGELSGHSLPDAIVLDLEMPDMSGVETIVAVRKLTSRPIIWVLTTFFDQKRRDQALGAGAADFFLKRNLSTQLVAAIRDVSTRFLQSNHTHVLTPH